MNFSRKDRFSDLPDNLLCHILSFLPTKDALKTSFLSTRFEGLFLHLMKIHINHGLHPQMVPFITRLLLYSEAGPLTDFTLESGYLPQSQVMVSWLNALLLRHAKVVHVVQLSESEYNYIRLPSELFMSDTLEDLKVCGRSFSVTFPKFANCPNLKALHLKCDGFSICDGFSVKSKTPSRHLRFCDESYPILEDLDLGFEKFLDDVPSISICLTALKRLRFTKIRDPGCGSSFGLFGVKNIEIHTPQLQNLNFMVTLSWVEKGLEQMAHEIEVSFRKCESLLSAVIGHFRHARVFMSFLWSINNVKKLHFIESLPLDLDYLAADMVRFRYLTHLKLTNTCSESAWFFLKRAPNLETFVYDGGCVSILDLEDNESDSEDDEAEDLDLPPRALREVRLRGLYWNEDIDVITEKDCVVEVARFFLQHGALLESLIIEYPQNMAPGWPSSALKQLNEVNRLSTECVIELKEEE